MHPRGSGGASRTAPDDGWWNQTQVRQVLCVLTTVAFPDPQVSSSIKTCPNEMDPQTSLLKLAMKRQQQWEGCTSEGKGVLFYNRNPIQKCL